MDFTYGRIMLTRPYIAFFLLLPCALAAQTAGTIAGRVTAANGTPVVGAFILLDAGSRPLAQTDTDGRYRVAGVAAGSHTVVARATSFASGTRTIDVGSAPARVDFTLSPTAATLSAVTVIGTRSDLAETRERVFQVAGAVDLIDPEEIRQTRQANLKDVLKFTPGVYVQPRFGAADESQISVRGSGLRNNFHARGINLLVNGMPYRNADGFTDFESLEVLTTEAIQVYKGANALRYGGSTLGGAIDLDTKTGYTSTPVSAFVEGGGYGFQKEQVSSGAASGPFDYYASVAHTGLDGFRSWSDQKRDRVNLHAGFKLSELADIRAFYLYAHIQEHLPGSVDRATLDASPTAADPTNVSNLWGRTYDLHHVGVQLRTQLTPTQRLEISPYLQYRDIDHPIFEVINQLSHDVGVEVRYENTTALGSHDNRLTVGFQPAHESMHNRQYQNAKGLHGNLTRDEQDKATNLAAYVEDALSLTPRLATTLGARVDRAERSVLDYFLSNGNQSDTRTYTPVTPRAGLLYSLTGGGQLFANASRTVEPPLFLELSSFGNSGGFINLAAQDAWQYEIGARAQRLGLAWEASLYDIELKNEILNLNVQPFAGAPFTVPTYRNSPKTRHTGVELGASYQLPGGVFVGGDVRDHLTARVAYTFGRFTYVRDSSFSGKDIPGAPRHYVNAELTYRHPSGFSFAPTIEWVPQAYYVNSQNSVKNNGWSNVGFRAEWAAERIGATAFVAGQNLADRVYSQSVQVDNAAGKFFEPADRRSFIAGLRIAR
jgi:iron complex outermembrane receptor protein